MNQEVYLRGLLRELPAMCASRETATLLEGLRKATEEHRLLLERQSDLIRLLREELKDVRDDSDGDPQPE